MVWVSVSGVTCSVGISVWSHVWCGYQCLESRVVWVSVSGVTCGVGISVWSHVWCGCQCLESRVVWVSVSGVTCGVGISVLSGGDHVQQEWPSVNVDLFCLQVVPLLSHPNDEIVREVLAFLKVMLYSGNREVQQGFQHLLETREERLFTTMRGLLQHAAVTYKERWVQRMVGGCD